MDFDFGSYAKKLPSAADAVVASDARQALSGHPIGCAHTDVVAMAASHYDAEPRWAPSD